MDYGTMWLGEPEKQASERSTMPAGLSNVEDLEWVFDFRIDPGKEPLVCLKPLIFFLLKFHKRVVNSLKKSGLAFVGNAIVVKALVMVKH
ncbi:hypothetical protein V6N13_111650 [Hibiscus sabdariffa]|uniref:Uncharacterized protein n=1 Tax=Hibiscus sabdariffa TaxID=183260 RepID=A0ABR2TKW9_9ROSI